MKEKESRFDRIVKKLEKFLKEGKTSETIIIMLKMDCVCSPFPLYKNNIKIIIIFPIP